MKTAEIVEGHCADCNYKKQEWVTVDTGDGEKEMLDRYCGFMEMFVPEWGYCWMWEPIHLATTTREAELDAFCEKICE